MINPDNPLLLAAGGASSRMGRPKHLLDFLGKPWIVWQLLRFQAAGGRRTLVVLPQGIDSGLSARDMLSVDVQVLWQAEPGAPMASSLKLAAAAAVQEKVGMAWWLPIDTPAPAVSLWMELERSLRRGESALAAVPAAGGHPVLLSRIILDRLAAWDPLAPSSRLDALLKALETRDQLARGVEKSDLCRLNLNTPEAWGTWLKDHPSLLTNEAEHART